MSAYTENPGWFQRDGDLYQVVRAIRWEIGYLGSSLFIDVPVGFRFDVSIPIGLGWLFNRHDRRFPKAAAIHDRILKLGWSRPEAAGPFHQALVADAVPAWRRFSMFVAVALFRFK